MNRMKTYAGASLAALCLLGATACSSSDDKAGAETTTTAAASDSRQGQIQPLSGASELTFKTTWAISGGGLGLAGADKVDPRTVADVKCSGSGNNLSVNVVFPDGSTFAGSSGSNDATVTFPGVPAVRIPSNSNLTWRMAGQQGVTANYSVLVTDQVGDASKLNIRSTAKFDVQC